MSRPTQAELVPIGTFAAAARLTVIALRHYAEVGVLTPAWVDPVSRYRYYRWDQLVSALAVSTLRDLDVPLDQIRAHLVDGVAVSEVLADHRTHLQAQADRANRALAVISQLEKSDELPSYDVTVVEVAERVVVTKPGRASASTLTSDAVKLIGELLAEAGAMGLDTSVPVVGEYPLKLTGRMSIRAHLPVSIGSGEALQAGAVKILPAGRFATVTHVGPIESLPLAYHGLLDWFHRERLVPHGPVFERYVDDPGSTPPDQLRTQISISAEVRKRRSAKTGKGRSRILRDHTPVSP